MNEMTQFIVIVSLIGFIMLYGLVKMYSYTEKMKAIKYKQYIDELERKNKNKNK